MRVLFVTPEIYPLMKIGGLGDVCHSLPTAMRAIGLDVRVLIPGYPRVLALPDIQSTGIQLTLEKHLVADILTALLPDSNVPLYIIDCPDLYRRAGTAYHDTDGNEWPDNALRFAYLSKAAALLALNGLDFVPDIIHCNDWTTGLVGAFLYQLQPTHSIKLMMSIHNLAHQGLYPSALIEELDLSWTHFTIEGYEYNGLLSFMKAGLFYADWITTVSPTYAKEICTERYGHGLQGVLQQKTAITTGILNGIDLNVWNPEIDPHIKQNYNTFNLNKKQRNKKILQKQWSMTVDENIPMLAVISRLVHQKGLDLILDIAADILHEGAQLVFLGIGEAELEQRLRQLQKQRPKSVGLTLAHDEALAHQIEAGADIFLMPSRFEPCGLNQLYSMHYATLPLVRKTGGLADSVIDTTPAHLNDKTATGFVFAEEDPQQLLHCIQRALLVYRDKKTWRKIQKTAMDKEVSWENSAEQYIQCYRQCLAEE